ncbi:unnamed protein product [Ilex paraguariensis]|uniref:Uncharacterized protein n=1 Tax=Ilex paraguariensis TaxID=185542 RepID=A0ABC8T8H5_9AQUA
MESFNESANPNKNQDINPSLMFVEEAITAGQGHIGKQKGITHNQVNEVEGKTPNSISKGKPKATAQSDLLKGELAPVNNSQQRQGPPKLSCTQVAKAGKSNMNATSSKDQGKANITPLRDVGGSMEVPQPRKNLPQVGNMVASSSSAIKSITNQCPNGPQDETQVTTNIVIAIIVSDKNHTKQFSKPIQSPKKFESLNIEGDKIVVDLSPVPCINSGNVAINKRQVMEVESIGHKP